MKRVIVHVERVVLRGDGRVDGRDIERALREELSRALAREGAFDKLAAPRRVPRLDATIVRPHGPQAVGRAVAHAIVGGAKS